MRLERHSGPNTWTGEPTSSHFIDSRVPYACAVRYAFPTVGHGTRKTSYFSVKVVWKDIEAMIEEFRKAGHPGALHLTEARQTLEQVRALVDAPKPKRRA